MGKQYSHLSSDERAVIDAGERGGLTTAGGERLRQLERENKELRPANEILKTASAFFRPGGARPPTQEMDCDFGVHLPVTVWQDHGPPPAMARLARRRATL